MTGNLFEQYWEEEYFFKKQLWIAGFHRNEKKLTELYLGQNFMPGNYVKMVEAFEIYDDGELARFRGKKCICEECTNLKPFIWTREHLLLENAISYVLNK